MKAKLIALCTVSIFTLAGCGSIPVPSSINSQSDFTTLALVTNNPDLSIELNALKDLPVDQRQARLNELKAKYPVDFTAMQNMMNNRSGGMMGNRGGMMSNSGGIWGGMLNFFGGMMGNKAANLQSLATTNPELAKDLTALKDLPAGQRQTMMAQLKTKYPDFFNKQGNCFWGNRLQELEKNYPEAAKELKALQDEYKAKMDALKAKYPDALKAQPKANPSPSASPAA